MSFLTLWLLVLILERSIASKHRNVNLALETVLQFDKTDDINVINKLQDFLTHIQVLIDKNRQVSDNVITRRKKMYKFTDFVEDLVTLVNSFNDSDLKQVFRTVDKDFRTRRVDTDLIDDNVRRFLNRKLSEIRNQPAITIRRDLDIILRKLRAPKKEKSSNILDFINTLYKRDSERKLSKLIKRLNLFQKSARKSKVVLKSIIEKIVNDVIYEHYNNLNDNEKGYIKKFFKAYLIDNISTDKKLKIKQRAKETELSEESVNRNEKMDESKPTNEVTPFQVTPFQLTSKPFKDLSKETTKKIFTYITLYPKTIKVKKILTGLPTAAIIEDTNEKNIKEERIEEETTESNEIFTNHSVEINVNLMLKHSRDSQNRDDSQIVKSLRAKSTPKKVFLRVFKKSTKNKRHKSSAPALSVETFGNLYRIRTPKKNSNKKISRHVAYTGKTTMKDKYLKSTYVADTFKEKSVLNKMHFVGDRRRFNIPTNLNEDKVPESAIKDIVRTTTQRSFTTRALVSLITTTNKLITSVVTTDKSTTKTTKNVVRKEILDNENVTNFKEVTKKPLHERIRTNIELVPKKNNSQFENDSNNHIIKKTTESEVSMISFDVKNYIKNSEVLNVEDDEKKKQIEEKMKADFGNLLESPTTNATTEGFTDIFKELEDAFEI